MAKFENGNKSNDNDRIHEYDNCTLLYSAVCLVLVVNHSSCHQYQYKCTKTDLL